MKRKRFRFLMHKPDYPPEVAAEIQACVLPDLLPTPRALPLIRSHPPHFDSRASENVPPWSKANPSHSSPLLLAFSHFIAPQQSSRISLHPDTTGSAQLPPKVKPLQTARQPQAYLMITLRRLRNYLPNHHQLQKLHPLLPHPNHALPSPLPSALSFVFYSDITHLLPPILRLESLEARCKILTQEKQRLARAPASCIPIPNSRFSALFSNQIVQRIQAVVQEIGVHDQLNETQL